MHHPLNRRQFVNRTLAAGTLASLGDLAFLHGLPPVRADDAKPAPGTVQLSPDIEPFVRLLEETPRDKLIETVAARVRQGTASYQQLLTAVLLAGVRGIKPRPVGYAFHAVLVINSAHLAALASSDHDRWLPLFWALDNFKKSQADNRQGGWKMAPVDEAKVPDASHAKQRFTEAMDNWDEEGADRAVVALARSAGAAEVAEVFFRYGARDFRDIGHKAIYVANSWRLMQTVGWRHAEPVLRSLAFALLAHEGDNPAKDNREPDVPWRDNLKRAAKVRADWQQGKPTPEAAVELLTTLRTGTPAEGSEKVVELLNKGVDPSSLWDGVFLTASELLMRQPGIGGLHCVTTANALHYAGTASGNDETRRMVLLQAAAFMPLFRKFMSRGKLEDRAIDKLEKVDLKGSGPEAVEDVFADVRNDRMRAAGKTLALLESNGGHAEELMAAARRLVFMKGSDAHDYKFSSAALEDFYHATPAWRNRFLAASTFWLRGAGDPDNDLIRRTRAALEKG
jgi:hypothetical protein